jgi:molybdenum cofactor cytidylyltransferase
VRFGPVPIAEAEGAVVAHTVCTADLVLKKGDIVAADHIAALAEAGLREIVVARIEADDIGENEAARQVAIAIGGESVTVDRAFTGRANLFSRVNGVLRIDVAAVDRLNDLDEAITLATLPDYRTVEAGEMVGTVKIIPFAVPAAVVRQALRVAAGPVVDIAPFRPLRVGVISTLLPGLKPQVVGKTLAHLAARLEPAGARIVVDERVPHETGPLVRALSVVAKGSDLIVIFGASAITDRRDVIPAAIEEAGGTIQHFGMPVDPGNLLLLGTFDGKPVIGAPGCARSPKENGFDWVLHRLLAGITVTQRDIRRLGVGGLLMEIVTRPQPRSGEPSGPASALASPRTAEVQDGARA